MWIKNRDELINVDKIDYIDIYDDSFVGEDGQYICIYFLAFHIGSEEIRSQNYGTPDRAQEVLDALYLALHDSSFNHFDMPEA